MQHNVLTSSLCFSHCQKKSLTKKFPSSIVYATIFFKVLLFFFFIRWLFWSDYNETTAKIVRMSMDGTQSTIIVTAPSVQFPNGLTYDYKTQTLFWIDAGRDIIGSVKADGTQMRVHVNLSRHFSTSHGFNLEFFNGEFYFSDWRGDDVRKISSANTTEERGEILRTFNRDPTTVRVLNIDRQPVPESESKMVTHFLYL